VSARQAWRAGAVRLAAAGLVAALDANAPHAPARLADTGLYLPDRPGVVAPVNRPFSPQYPLWSDGAVKSRWVYLPPGAAIETTDPLDWKLPVGTRFWKEFTFGGRKVETRFIWRATTDRWVFASYQWNAEGTDAVLAPEEGVRGAAELARGRSHAIPSSNDCRACHETTQVEPLGFNALQLSTDRDPHAIHGEPLAPDMVTIRTLNDEGRLGAAGAALLADPPRIRARSALTRTVLGYLGTNCGGCHNDDSGIVRLGASLKHADALDGEAVLQAMASHETRWQVPAASQVRSSRLIDPDNPASSALLVRMRSRRPSSQMPPLGTILQDAEAVETITRWIETEVAERVRVDATR
jgi:hypothetical protein